MEINRYQIPAQNIEALREKIAVLNKKAKKLGCDTIVLTVDTENPVFIPVEETNVASDGEVFVSNITVKAYNVEIIGNAPKFADWEWLATIMFDTVTGVATLRKPAFSDYDVTTLYHYLDNPNVCEHCGINRVRKNTYIVRNVKTGELKQVGSACIKDFTGHTNPNAVASFYENLAVIIDSIDEEFGREFTADVRYHFYKFDELMEYFAAIINKCGYVPTKNIDGNQSTKDFTLSMLHDYRLYEEIGFRSWLTDETKKLATDAVAWVKGEIENKKMTSEFYFNLGNIIKGAETTNMVEYRNIGYLAPVVNMYLKTFAEPKPEYKNEFVGNVGDKIEFTGKVARIHEMENMYGPGNSFIYTIKDSEGRTYTWFTNQYLELHETYTFKGRLKEHRTYGAINQTVITRAKFAVSENKIVGFDKIQVF